MKLTVITCTGDRPEAFLLCEKWMIRQTAQPFQWIVICDGKTPTVCTQGQEFYYRPEHIGPDSLKKKVREVATSGMVRGDALTWFEDDDFFGPQWLQFCAEKLQRYDLIGEGRALYYNVRDRFWVQHQNMQHASLCATAVKTSLLSTVAASCNTPSRWIDDILWRQPVNKMVFDPVHNPGGKPMTVGIKGMPGRAGFGWGHVHRPVDATDDPSLDYLRRIIGDDARVYEPLYNPKILAGIYSKYQRPEHGISDKGTTHSYIEEYERLFAPFRECQPARVLEIGLCRGGSLRMWHEYFDKSQVHGIDISSEPDRLPDLRKLMDEQLPRMIIDIVDARDPVEVRKKLGETRFDIIIEDTTHDISDSLAIYKAFIPRLNPGGLYIIEDVADIDQSLPAIIGAARGRRIEVKDFRTKKNRFDDVLVVVR